MMSTYYNLKFGLHSKPQLVTIDQLKKITIPKDKDAYISIFSYNEEQKARIEQTGSVAGIKDVTTDTLVWDFDSKADPEKARQDVLELATRLVDQYNVSPDQIQTYYSGSKGMHVFLPIGKKITPDQFKKATSELAKGLETFDTVVSDPNRIIRLEFTKHPTTGLYKIPLDIDEVANNTIEDIKVLAETADRDVLFDLTPVTLPETLFKVEKKKEAPSVSLRNELDLTKKPKGIQDYVYALLEGYYNEGERHQAMMVLAAKCRALGYDKEATYYLCKSSIKKQARRLGIEEFDKTELWDNIIEKSIYSDRWEGGSYSPKNNPWLAGFCDKLGIRWNNNTDANITTVNEAFDTFDHFATNIDNLTIRTGIAGLDENLRMTVGMSVGLIASPGVGKTSISLQILNNMSKMGNRCIFFSYDMYAPIVYQKLVQKHFNIGATQMFEKFKTDPAFKKKVKETITKEYEKVSFCFKTGQTVNDIIETIKETEESTGEKVKFIVMDYNELVITDYSDPTQSSSYVAQKMREIAQSMDILVFSLFQPSKMSGTPADEIKSYNSAKGSGAISQSVSIMLGMSRPGYNPQEPDNDKYINLACLKNRMGPLFSLDFTWEGRTGTIGRMTDDDYETLKQIREKKKNEESGSGGWN